MIDRRGGRQRLPFARLHFGDFAIGHNESAEDLHVEGALAEHALGHSRRQGKGFGERGAGSRGSAQAVIVEVVELRPAPVDVVQLRLVFFPGRRSGHFRTDQIEPL